MTFTLATFAVDGSHFNSGITRTHKYTTADTQADINTAGYFNAVAPYVSAGDAIECYVDTDGTPARVKVYVNSNTNNVVDVTDGVVETATDSD